MKQRKKAKIIRGHDGDACLCSSGLSVWSSPVFRHASDFSNVLSTSCSEGGRVDHVTGRVVLPGGRVDFLCGRVDFRVRELFSRVGELIT